MFTSTSISPIIAPLVELCKEGGALLNHRAGRAHAVVDDYGIVHVWFTPLDNDLWIEGFDFAWIGGDYLPVKFRSDIPLQFTRGGYRITKHGARPHNRQTMVDMTQYARTWLESVINSILENRQGCEVT